MQRGSRAPPRLLLLANHRETEVCVCKVADALDYALSVSRDLVTFREQFQQSVEIVVLDLTLPHIDGVEVLRCLRTSNIECRLVMLSSADNRVGRALETLALAYGIRVIGHLRKPVTRAFLASLLRLRGTELRSSHASPVSIDGFRNAVGTDELAVVFQPKVDLVTRSVVAMEALARWRHPSLGWLSAAHFIPCAEASGLIDALTDDVMRKAFAECARWHASGWPLKVAVNVSPSTLTQLDLPQRVLALARDTQLDPNDVILEVTENRNSEDLLAELDVVTRLRMTGFDISLDDFGAGYSTTARLNQLPANELKIDGEIIRAAEHEVAARWMIKDCVERAGKLGLRLVAEGVEVWGDLVFAAGCQQAQGFLFGGPMPARRVLGWLDEWAAKSWPGPPG
ncbi:MAG: EAL domain-containing response regulator [Gammaproteobacteria bacterium]|nr:EAL domain-containing response regulator [Gammaproteobacteria bacterium]